MVWIRRIIIIVIGAMPATFLLWFALIPLIAAVSVLGEDPLRSLVIIIWFLLAAIGTTALWLASFQPAGPRLLAGLLAGMLAIGPFAYFLMRDFVEDFSDAGSVTGFLIVGPTAVAVVLVLSFFRQRP
jgi:hypothetical protein